MYRTFEIMVDIHYQPQLVNAGIFSINSNVTFQLGDELKV